MMNLIFYSFLAAFFIITTWNADGGEGFAVLVFVLLCIFIYQFIFPILYTVVRGL